MNLSLNDFCKQVVSHYEHLRGEYIQKWPPQDKKAQQVLQINKNIYISTLTHLLEFNDRTGLLFKNNLCLEDIETVIDFGNPEYITKMLNKNFTLSKDQITLLQNKALELKNKNLILYMIDHKIRFPMKYAIELVEYDIVNKLLEVGYDLTEKDYNGEDISSMFHREDTSLPKKKIFNLIKEQYEKQTGLSNSDTQSITSLQIENAMLRSENMGLKHTIEMLKHQLIAQSVSRK
jgi:hypothetical protein